MVGTKSTCGACGEIFRSIKGFDAHRVGKYEQPIRPNGRTLGYTKHTRRCLSPDEMQARGMWKNEEDYWMLPGQGGQTEHQDAAD